jgi:hypothetical protein
MPPKTEDTPPDAAAEETAPPAPEVEAPPETATPPAPETATPPAPEAEEIVPPTMADAHEEEADADAPDLRTAIAIFIEGGQQFVAAAAGLQAYIDHLNAQLAATGPDAEPYVYTPPRGDG